MKAKSTMGFKQFLFLLVFSTVAFAPGGNGLTAQEVFDHHAHVLSPELIAYWKSVGMQFSQADERYTDPLFLLQHKNIRGAFLVSMAHLYTTERMGQLDSVKGNEQELVSRENDFIARCVAADPKNLVGFFSVNPLREYAIQEMERCSKIVGLTGLKLHLPACEVSLDDDSHVKRLGEVFDWAEENDVPILIHLFTGAAGTRPRVERFWNELVRPRENIKLNLAHLGAAGGFNASTRMVLDGFERLCENSPEFGESEIYFDLSGAIILAEIEGAAPTSDQNCRVLSDHMKRIGIGRFLFASDYPVFSVDKTMQGINEKLSLDPGEIETLLENRSPIFGSKRARDFGIPFEGATGRNNAITDVAGVLVGHSTIIAENDSGSSRTGVTAILANRNLDRMFAGTFVLNGNGEMTGRAFIDEWGYLISPIMLTNTLSVGTVRDAVVKWADQREQIGRDVNLPVVGETWDGFLNDIRGFHVKEKHVFEALDSAQSGPVVEGNVGGGTGMVCHVFKGGIGTSSRKLTAEQGGFTVGVLVQANYGSRQTLTVAGIPVGKQMLKLWPERGAEPTEDHEDGSIMIVVGTDAPLLPHQLKRVAKRAALGLAKVGGTGGTESGDIFIAFSTSGLIDSEEKGVRTAEFLRESRIDAVFEATINATEEAIVNALIAAETMSGNKGNKVYELPEHELIKLLKAHNRLK